MRGYADWMGKLIASFEKLPGIGRRSAERIVFHLLTAPKQESAELSRLLDEIKSHVLFCSVCHNFSDRELCHICSDPGRDQSVICVVEDPKDVISFEKTGAYVGVYHVLLGALSALNGIGPGEIQIRDLVERIRSGKVREVIFATNSNTEGETTALYLAKLLKPFKIKTTRLARGIPVGSHIEFMDQATLSRSLEGRQPA